MIKGTMRTTVTIDEKLVRELMQLSHAKNKTAAVASAVKEPITADKTEKSLRSSWNDRSRREGN